MASENILTSMLETARHIKEMQRAGGNTAPLVGGLLEQIVQYLGNVPSSGGGSGSGPGGNIDINTLGNYFLSKNSADTARGRLTLAQGANISGPSNTGTVPLVVNSTNQNGTSIQASGSIETNGGLKAKGDITTDGKITAKGNIESQGTIIAPNSNITNGIFSNLTTDSLTVLGGAHFFELIIDQLRAQKGAVIITGGHCTAEHIEEEIEGGSNRTISYKIFYRAVNEDGQEIYQSFIRGDQAICQSFGNWDSQVLTDVSTTYYWRLVTQVGTVWVQNPSAERWTCTPTQTEGYTKYHYIILSNNNDPSVGPSQNGTGYDDSFDSTVNGEPQIGDEIVQLGYRTGIPGSTSLTGNDLKARQSAIILSAYPTKDTGVIPPSITFYQEINDFNLTNHRSTCIDATGASFVGTFTTRGGKTFDDDDITVNQDTWTIFPSTALITKDSNNIISPSSINIKLLHRYTNTQGDIVEDVYGPNEVANKIPEGYRIQINYLNSTGVVQSHSEFYSGEDLVFQVPSATLYDTYLIELQDDSAPYSTKTSYPIKGAVVSATSGINGGYWETVYRNFNVGTPISNMDPPTIATAWVEGTTGTNNWSKIRTDEAGKLTYECSRWLYYNPSNQVVYSNNWTGPFRCTGEPGPRGADGNGIKNIYTIVHDNNIPSAPTFNTYGTQSGTSKGFPDSGTTSLVDDNGITWYDDAPQVSSLNGGDIYCSQSYTSVGDGTSGNPKIWINWRTPGIYFKWPDEAEVTEVDRLIAFEEAFEVKLNEINENTKYEDIAGGMACTLKYGVAHIEGGNVEYANAASGGHSGLSDYRIAIAFDGETNIPGKYTASFSELNINLTSTESVDNHAVVSFSNSNILSSMNVNAWVNAEHFPGTTGDKDANHTTCNYHWLVLNGFTSYLPSKVTVYLYKVAGNTETLLDTREVILVFEPDGMVKMTKTVFNSVYQGLGGNGAATTTGFSQIKQTWDRIGLSVTNIERFNPNGSLNIDKNTAEAVFYRTAASVIPNAPSGDITNNSSNVNTTWTKNTDLAPNSTYKYVYYSLRAKSTVDGTPIYGEWSNPKLYKYWDTNTSSVKFATTINSAQLKIEADSISSTVEQQIPSLRTDISRIEQTASSISMSVSRSSYNLLIDPEFEIDSDNNSWPDYWIKLVQPSSYPVSKVSLAKQDYNMLDGRYSIKLDMQYNTGLSSGGVRIGAQQQLADSVILRPGAKIMTSCYVKINQSGSDKTRIGMDFITTTPDVFYTTLNTPGTELGPKIYIDDVEQNFEGSGTDNRLYGQIQINDGTQTDVWHKFDIQWTVKTQVSSDELIFGLYGWYDITNVGAGYANQPLIYFNLPHVSLLDADGKSMTGTLARTGIDITQGKITLQAGKVQFTTQQGQVNPKVEIDAETGTLRAVDGVFSGSISAGVLAKSYVYSMMNVGSNSYLLLSQRGDSDTTPAWLDASASGRIIWQSLWEEGTLPIKLVLYATGGQGNVANVELPPAKDFVGQEIEIFKPYSGVNLIIRGGSNGGNLYNYDFTGDNTATLSQSSYIRLLAICNSTSTTYGWVVLDYSDGVTISES